jgi:DNA-directed RNA polymerase-3 subunit RPC5
MAVISPCNPNLQALESAQIMVKGKERETVDADVHMDVDHSEDQAPGSHAAPSYRNTDMDDDEDDGDDDDPIVKRIPVYYTPHYLSSLTLLQYPDRPPRPHTQHPLLPPSLRPGADPEPNPERTKLKAKYNPKSQHLQVEVPIERDPERWNEESAKEFARGLPSKTETDDNKGKGKGRAKRMTEEREEAERRAELERDARRLDSMHFGSLVVPDVTNYLVGVVKDGALPSPYFFLASY